MSATIIPGDVVPSTAVVAETPSGLLAGTLINLSTATGGLTIMQGASAAFTNAGGESGNNTTNWDSLGGDSLFSNVSDTNLFGSKAFQSVYSLNPDGVCCYGTDPGTTDTCSNPPGTQNIQSLINFQIFSSYGDGSRDLQHDPIASSTVFVGGLLSSVPITLNIPISPTPMIRLLVTQGSGVGMFSVPFVVGTSVSIKYRNSSSSSLRCRVNWDVDESVSPQPGRYTSNRYYVGVSTPIYGVFTSSVTPSSDTSITFKTQVAQTNVSTLDSGVAAVSGGYIGSANGEPYVVVTASFTLTLANATIFPPQMSGWSIASDTTGYFIASCLPTSPNVGWGLFQATDLPGNGSVTFAVSTGTTCDSVQQATATWTAQTINQNITVSTASYLGIRVLLSGFTQFVSTAQPTLQSITANWTSSAGRPHTASQIYNNRYWLAFTTATSASAYNNSVLVLDEQNRWSNLSGINAASFMTYNRLLYSGSSLSDGNVNTQDSGLTDFGNPILLDFKSPTYELGAFNPVDLYDLNIEAQSDHSATPSLQYFVDNDTTPYTMGTINLNLGTPGLIYSTARFGQTNAPTKTHTLSYEILDTSYSPLTFYRSMIRFTPEDGP